MSSLNRTARMPSEVHTIRLAGPWQVDWVGPEDVPPATLAVDHGTFPIDWPAIFGDVCGTARFQRKFNRPTGLSEGTRVWLSVPDYCGMLTVELNGRVLAILPENELPVQLDVTGSLQLHNRLVLEVTADGASCSQRHLAEPVKLEIHEH